MTEKPIKKETKKAPVRKMVTRKTPVRKATAKKGPIKNSLEQNIAETVNKLKKHHKWNAPFSAELFISVIEKLEIPDPITGFKPTLLKVLKEPNMPSRASFYRWLDNDKSGELRKVYSAVQMASYDDMHDERFEIANDISDDVTTCQFPDGSVIAKWDELNIFRAKEMNRVREWSMARLAPAKYGDNIKIDMEVDASPEALEVLSQLGEENRLRAANAAIEHAKTLASEKEE